jgi:hypothetical protein
VRVVDPEVPDAVIANHPRTFDRVQRVEQEGHVMALVAEKRRAHRRVVETPGIERGARVEGPRPRPRDAAPRQEQDEDAEDLAARPER